MREYIDLRVKQRHAGDLFASDEGKDLDKLARQVLIRSDDPRLNQIGPLQEFYNSKNDTFYYWWDYQRQYSQAEFNDAEVLRLDVTAVFEPSGEECGTVYNESESCPHCFYSKLTLIQGRRIKQEAHCGVGGRQISDLILDVRKIPKGKDIARSIANEYVISQRLAELLFDAKMTGFELRPVHHQARFQDDPVNLEEVESGRELLRRAQELGIRKPSWGFDVWMNQSRQKDLVDRAWREHLELNEKKPSRSPVSPVPWYQLLITSRAVSTEPPTKWGVTPWNADPEGKGHCPRGHYTGWTALSELTLSRGEWDGSDIVNTKEFVGHRAGLLRPYPYILISHRLWQLFRKERVRGYKVEVAHFA